MIRINLLPEEYRRAERTSFKLFAGTLAAAMVVCSAFGWFGFVYFGELSSLEEDRHSVEETLKTKKERSSYHDALAAEKKDYESRSETIQDICKSRMSWTEVLDQIIDVVNNDGNTERHMAWFNSMNVRDNGDAKYGPQVGMPGFVQSNQFKKVVDSHDDLELAPVFTDALEQGAPSAQVTTNLKRNPPEAVASTLDWKFKTPKDWAKNKKQPAKPVGK